MQEKSAIALRSDLGSSSSSIVESGQGVQDNKVKNQVQKWINDDTSPVVVFSKTTCPYCEKVKKLLDELSIKANVIELDSLPNGAEIQEALLVISGQKTVPNVFIRGRHIGGCDATTKLHQEGKLLSLVRVFSSTSPKFFQISSP
jgi:glutaredoxin